MYYRFSLQSRLCKHLDGNNLKAWGTISLLAEVLAETGGHGYSNLTAWVGF